MSPQRSGPFSLTYRRATVADVMQLRAEGLTEAQAIAKVAGRRSPSVSTVRRWIGEIGKSDVADTTWVHGHAGVLQTSQGFSTEALGFYLRVKAEQPAVTWVHYAPPSMTGSLLTVVSIAARTFGGCVVSRVHIWDGAHQVGARDELDVHLAHGEATQSDDHSAPFEVLELVIPPHEMRSALGVSIELHANAAPSGAAIVAVGGTCHGASFG